jgi:RNA polymerase sigma-70 factor (ECF subfamily)
MVVWGKGAMQGTRSDPVDAPAGRTDIERRWLRGDPNVLADAHRCYHRRLEAVAFRIVRSRADAEDVVQRVFQALPGAGYRGDASLWSYLYRAAVNGSVNLLRARRRRDLVSASFARDPVFELRPAASDPESRVLEGEILACVARALLRVKPQHRRVLVLRVKHGLSNVEIARQEGIPPATVATWLRRGREELRAALGPTLRDLEEGPP